MAKHNRINKRFNQSIEAEKPMIEAMQDSMGIGKDLREEADILMRTNLRDGMKDKQLERFSRIHNSPQLSATRLSNFLRQTLMPLEEFWLDIGLRHRTKQEETLFLSKELQEQVQNQMRNYFYDGALEINVKLALDECINQGSGCIFTGWNALERKPYYKRIPTDSLAWKLNDFKVADTVHCTYEETYGSLKAKFPMIEKISPLKNGEMKDWQNITYHKLIKPNAPNTIAKKFTILYYYDDTIFYDRDNLSFNPYIIFPYELAPKGPYGIGPVIRQLDTIRAFYKAIGLDIRTLERRIAPPFQTNIPVTNRDSMNFEQGGLFTHAGTITPLQTATGSQQTAYRSIEMLAESIEKGFNDTDIPVELMQYTSPTVANIREQKRYEGLDATAQNMERMLPIRVGDNTLRMMIENNDTINPESGKSNFIINPDNNLINFESEMIDLRLSSGIKKALMRMRARAALEAFDMAQPLIGNPELYPNAQGLLDEEKFGRYILDNLGMFKDSIRDEEQLADFRKQKAEEMQEQMAAMEAQQGEQTA